MSAIAQDQNSFATQIVAELQRIFVGLDRWRIFDDFLEVTERTLLAMPRHAESVANTGKLAVDTPEDQAFFAEKHTLYESDFEHFKTAFHLLLDSASQGIYVDVIGAVYMLLEVANQRSGQFFTPTDITQLMVGMQDVKQAVLDRIKAALLHPDNLMGVPVLLCSGLTQTEGDVQQYFFEKVIPAALPYYETYAVYDPCCGSGGMFLSVANTVPRWMLDLGLIKFFGQDIDGRCVQMCRINFLLYGIGNQVILQSAVALLSAAQKLEVNNG